MQHYFRVLKIKAPAREALAEVGAVIGSEGEMLTVEVEAKQLSSRDLEGWRKFGGSSLFRLPTGKVIGWDHGRDVPDPPFNYLYLAEQGKDY